MIDTLWSHTTWFRCSPLVFVLCALLAAPLFAQQPARQDTPREKESSDEEERSKPPAVESESAVEETVNDDTSGPAVQGRRESEEGSEGEQKQAASQPLENPLPWEETVKSNRKLPAQRLQNARQMLEMFGIDESQWHRLEDGRPYTEAENELLYKILFRIPRFLLEDIERWQHYEADWSRVAREIDETRGEMYLIKGRATRVEQVELIPELATLYEFRKYYRVTVEHGEKPVRQSLIFTRKIPSTWPLGKPLDERVHVSGLLLKLGESPAESVDSSARLIFAAQRIAWFPEQVEPKLGVTSDRQLLASLGMDLSLLDEITQRTGVSSREREAFYQMLAAIRHDPSGDIGTTGNEAEKQRPISRIDPLFQAPERQVGQLKTFVGTARRISKVECDPDIRRRLGLSHYYQVDVFIPLENSQIRLGRKEETPEDEEAPVFTNSFPFTLCVAKLPEGMKETQDINEQIRFNAFFFKLWTYNTVYMTKFGSEKKQIGPMLIGKQFELVQPPVPLLRPYLGTIFGVLFLVALVGMWYGLWRNFQADDEFQRTTLSKSYEVPGGKSLNEVGIEEAAEPDFRNWGEREVE